MRSLQSDIEQRGTRIFELVDKHPERLFSKAGFYQRLMALSMHDERFKTQLFRFVAVLPSLRGSSEIIQHLEEYFSDNTDEFSPLVGMGVRAARLVPWISAPVLRWTVSAMARQSIAGRTAARHKRLDRPGRKKRGPFSGCKSVGQNLCPLFANESGCSGRCDRASQHQAA